MYPNQELDIVEAFLKAHTPSDHVTGAFQTISEKVKSYDAVVEYYAKQSEQLKELLDGNMALSLTILAAGGKK